MFAVFICTWKNVFVQSKWYWAKFIECVPLYLSQILLWPLLESHIRQTRRRISLVPFSVLFLKSTSFISSPWKCLELPHGVLFSLLCIQWHFLFSIVTLLLFTSSEKLFNQCLIPQAFYISFGNKVIWKNKSLISITSF